MIPTNLTALTILGHTKNDPPTIIRRGFGMVESVFSIVLVGGLLVAALNTVGASATAQQHLTNRSTAHLLAHDLMTEILVLPYEDPDGSPLFGPEAGEGTANRSDFDDVDDYKAWNAGVSEDKMGTPIPGYEEWTRLSMVEWVDPNNLTLVSMTPTSVKRITVKVMHSHEPAHVLAVLVAVRTQGPPPPSTGTPILFVVGDVTALTAQESTRVAMLESWNFTANLIAAGASQEEYDVAAGSSAAAYVPSSVDTMQLGNKLRNAVIGVVNGSSDMADEFGFCSMVANINVTDLRIVSNLHYITNAMGLTWITLYTSTQPTFLLNGTFSSDIQFLGAARTGPGPVAFMSFSVLDPGAALVGGGTAAGRRVMLPWGAGTFDFNALNAAGQGILQRSLEWAAELDGTPAPEEAE